MRERQGSGLAQLSSMQLIAAARLATDELWACPDQVVRASADTRGSGAAGLVTVA